MDLLTSLALRTLRKLYGVRPKNGRFPLPKGYIDYCGNEGCNKILSCLKANRGGYMLSKWGTCEFARAMYNYVHTKNLTWKDYKLMIRRRMLIPTDRKAVAALYNNAGVFPNDESVHWRFGDKALEDCQLMDILCSYVKEEPGMSHFWGKAIKIDLDAYCAPWMFDNPWTQWLEGKKVLVVHPFIESIQHQYYNNREKLFDNPKVLPRFKELICIKAVQSQGGEKPPFADWFEALKYMEGEIDRHDYDVALIGCGAYGMSLAAHVKRQGKVGIHLAGWTQMLFGVYGERWVKQPRYAKYINEYWIRPNEDEQIKNADSIEGACYW